MYRIYASTSHDAVTTSTSSVLYLEGVFEYAIKGVCSIFSRPGTAPHEAPKNTYASIFCCGRPRCGSRPVCRIPHGTASQRQSTRHVANRMAGRLAHKKKMVYTCLQYAITVSTRSVHCTSLLAPDDYLHSAALTPGNPGREAVQRDSGTVLRKGRQCDRRH